MDFCKTCDSLLQIQIDDNNAYFICTKCNSKTKLEKGHCIYFVNKTQSTILNNYSHMKDTNILPIIKHKCNNCNNDELMLLREINTIVDTFYICKNCNKIYKYINI